MDYKDKLEEAKRLYKTADGNQRYILERLFPEVVECEDERIRNEICTYIGAKQDISLYTHNRWLGWLEKQNKQSSTNKIEQNLWSEEDEKRANRIAAFIWKNRKGDTDEVYQQERDIDWLKSLKDKYTWKPTKEQINALDEVYKTHGANSVCRRIIITLLNDLKKLK